MSLATPDFTEPWKLSRQRFIDETAGLTDAQLRWRLQPGVLTIGEMALHVAGVEISFTSQMEEMVLSPLEELLISAPTDGVVNDFTFPLETEEITVALVAEALAAARLRVEPLMSSASDEALHREVQSVLGPIIDGRGALVRLAFHAGYHWGQASLLKRCPGFPQSM